MKRREWRSAWGGREGERVRESERERVRERKRERDRVHTRGIESPRESTLDPPFICFFCHLSLPYAN